MSFLFERVGDDLADRVDITGGWGDAALHLGFRRAQHGFRGKPCDWLSPLEGDAYGDLKPGYDMVVLNLQLAWLDHDSWFRFIHSLLAPGGRFYFSTLGPDTLHELADAWRRADAMPHVHPFVDMHHLGDAMVRAGFSQPVLDADWMGVEYEDADLLMDDLRQEGFHNVHPLRRRTLTGRTRLEKVKRELAVQSPVKATFELLYGFATVSPGTPGQVRVQPPFRQKD